MIPIFSNTRQNKIIAGKLDSAIKEVIASGFYILGPKVAQFEEAFAKYLGVKYAIGVASGTDALSLALLSAGVGKGDEVILPANSYPTVFAVTAIGAVPRLVDIDPKTYNIDPKKIPSAVTEKTKAIIPVHLYGQPADLALIYQYINKLNRKLYVIEDCCQAHGAEIGFQINSPYPPLTTRGGVKGELCWKKCGSIGDIGCFSFYPTKNLGCFGDGGMVVTNNEEIAKKIKLLRMYGEEKRYKSVMLGRNSRLDELQAAILLVKLKYLDIWNEKRRKIAHKYKCQMSQPEADQPLAENFKFQIDKPIEASYAKHVYHLFVIRTKRRDEAKTYLEKRGIQTSIHYPSPIHFQPSFEYLGYKEGDFPEAEKASREILSLPMFPELKKEEVGIIVKTIRQFEQEGKGVR